MSKKGLAGALLVLLAFSLTVRLLSAAAPRFLAELGASEAVARVATGYYGPLETPEPSADGEKWRSDGGGGASRTRRRTSSTA